MEKERCHDTLLSIAEQSSIIGVDIGGTKTFVARYSSATFELEAEERIATDAQRGFSAVVTDVLSIIRKLQTPGTRAVGIGVAGLVRRPENILLKAPNIPGSGNVDLMKAFRDIGLPVFVDNDANCFALAEAVMGTGKGKKIVVGITIGTGVGGGIVINGTLFRGAHGFAGEIGHMLLMPGKPPEGTENPRGEVEQFLSGTALGRRCRAAKHPGEYLQGDVCSFLQPDLFREVAWLCTSLTHLLDPSIIIFGGSTGTALGPHLPAIRQALKEWMLPDTPMPEIAIAAIHHAGVLGAALLCTEN